MPAFGGTLSAAEIKAVAAFVAGDRDRPPRPHGHADGDGAPSHGREDDPRRAAGPDGITVDDGGRRLGRRRHRRRRSSASTPTTAAAGQAARPSGASPTTRVVDRDGTLWVVLVRRRRRRRGSTGGHGDADPGRPGARGPGGRPAAFVWVTNAGDGTVTRIDRATRARHRRADRGRRPPARDRRGRRHALGHELRRRHGDAPRRADRPAAQGDPSRSASSPRGVAAGGGSVWVANSGDGTVTPIDLRDRRRPPCRSARTRASSRSRAAPCGSPTRATTR